MDAILNQLKEQCLFLCRRGCWGGRGFVLLGVGLEKVLLLGHLALIAALASLLHLGSARLGLVTEHLGARVLGLLLVNVLHEYALVLEHITLALHVQVVIQMLVYLLSLSVTLEQPAEHAHAADPDDFLWHASVCRTLSLAGARVTSLPARQSILAHARPRVHGNRLADDQTVLDQLANVLTRVSV